MGSLKDEMFENDEHKRDVKLAGVLGITVDELSQLNYEFDENTGNDDSIYGYTVQFDTESSPKRILDKIQDLNDGSWVSLPLNWAD